MYLEDFNSVDDLKKEYDITDADLEGINILYAVYRIGSYEGQSLVLFEKDNKLFIVDANHCSCYGLEGQWSPDETNEAALKMEVKAKSKYHFDEFKSFIEFCTEYFKWGQDATN